MTDMGIIAGNAAFDSNATYSTFARVCSYWASLRQDGSVPRRARIDPQALADALPDVFLAEIVAPHVARLRLCGHRIEDLMGMDMRGMPLSVLCQGDAREALAEALEQVALGARVILSLQAEDGFGLPPMQARLALMPLADEAGRITRILGVIERDGEAGRAPRRFALAKPLAQPDAVPQPARKPPVLRVITGGRR